MARVSGIISAGLQSATQAKPADTGGFDIFSDDNAERRTRVSTAGMPNDLLSAGVAGAGIGAIFGPVGALLGAGIVHHLSSQRREGIAQYQQELALDNERVYNLAKSGLDEMAELATNDEERAEVEFRRKYVEQLASEISSVDPERAMAASTEMLAVTNKLKEDVDGWFDERRELNQEIYERHNDNIARADGIRDDYVKESGSFDVVRKNYEGMFAVENSSWGDQVLMVRAFKVIDPNSAVLPGEAATAANAAGVPDWALTAYNRLAREGGRLDPKERADIMRQTGLQYGSAYAEQSDRRSAAIERARAQGVPDDLLGQIHSAVRLPTTDELPFPRASERPDPVDQAAIMGLEIARDEYGVTRAYEPGKAGQPGYEVKDLPMPQDARGQAGLEAEAAGPNADIDPETGEPLGFWESLFTPGAIDARRRRHERNSKRPTN